MRIGILSDTHDRQARTLRAVDVLVGAGAEALIHCGDLTRPDLVHICASAGVPCHYVFGNNDFDRSGLIAAMDATGGVNLGDGDILELAGRRIAVTHGDDPRVFRRLLSTRPDYLLFGHSHVPHNERDGETRQINPGALHRAASWTVALLDTDSDLVTFVKID